MVLAMAHHLNLILVHQPSSHRQIEMEWVAHSIIEVLFTCVAQMLIQADLVRSLPLEVNLKVFLDYLIILGRLQVHMLVLLLDQDQGQVMLQAIQ